MLEVTATEASRNFADLLDGVEHRGERYRIVRRGHVVAQLEPVSLASGVEIKNLLRSHRIDRSWAKEAADLRAGLVTEDRF